jgi:uncharacterized protein (DUF2062 family)
LGAAGPAPPPRIGPRRVSVAEPEPLGWGRRLLAPVLVQLKQGLAPHEAALALSLGLWLGLLPLMGLTTLACLMAALGLRLNLVLMQAVNYLAYPLQLALLLPFYAAGARVFGGPALTLSLGQLLEQARQAPWALMQDLWWVGWHGVAVWAALGLVAVPLLYALAYLLLRRFPGARPA